MKPSMRVLLAASFAMSALVLWSACGGSDEDTSADAGTAQPGRDASAAQPGPDASAAQPGPDATTVLPGPDADTVLPGPDAATVLPGPDAGTEPDAGAGGTYGMLTSVSFSTNYLLDYAQLNDQAYQQAHQAAFQTTAAFTGTYTSTAKPIPPAGAAQTFALGMHIAASGSSPASVAVMQQSQSTSAVLGPVVQMQFTTDALTTGTKTVGLTETDGAMLFVIDLPSECMAALGIGSIDVTTASNTTAEGGAVAFTGSNITLYHPTATPYGDISSQITASGQTVCAKE